MTTILLTGRTGQIGGELLGALGRLGTVIAPDRRQMDLADPDSIRAAVRDIRPDVIVNAGGYTAVDKAESEPELAMLVNARMTGVLAEETRKCGAYLLHFSSAYVFDGRSERPYAEGDATLPVNVYGRSKLAGEQAIAASGASHLIMRLSWVYCDHGRNFLLTMLRFARERESIDVVRDHYASPTWARSIADATRRILSAPRREGIYHYSAGGETSRFGWTQRLFELTRAMNFGLARYPTVRPVLASEYPDIAARPSRCSMSNDKIIRDFGLAIASWEGQLSECLEELLARGRAVRVAAG